MKKPVFGLCAIMRDEGPYILEWVAYHRAIGFDRIRIYDNQSSDGTADICRALARSGDLEYISWPDVADAETGPQLPAYVHAAETMQADWLCCLDADEFFVLETAQTLDDLVAAAGRPQMPIALCWRIFGSGGALTYSDAPVIARFTRASTLDHFPHVLIKTMGPVSALRAGAAVHHHGWLITPEQHFVDAIGRPFEIDRHTFARPATYRGAWINHYIIKSREEFEMKMRRGLVSAPVSSPTKFTRRTYESFFLPHDTNDVEERTILRFLPAVRAGMARLQNAIERERWWLSLQDQTAAPVAAPPSETRSMRTLLFGWMKQLRRGA